MIYAQRRVWLGMLTGLLFLAQSTVSQARPLGRPKGNSSTGAIRGACPVGAINLQHRKLMALVDTSDPVLTTQAYPTFWVYQPVNRTEAVTTAEFELLDADQNPVITPRKILLALPDKAGIARFTLPASQKPLTVGQEYFWVLRVVCDKNDRSANPTVTGWIKRVQPDLAFANSLKATPALDQYKVYAENKIWWEYINFLAQNRDKQSQDWTSLLTLFGLQNFAPQPIQELKAIAK